MNTFKRLALAITLAMLLAGTALAQETNAPPCSNNPGELSCPPCPVNQMMSDDPVDQNAASSETVQTFTDLTAISAIENLLTIY